MGKAKPSITVAGKTVVLTGEMTGIGRREATAKLEKLGARVTGSVSKHTDYVFASHGAGDKRDAAERLGVTILGEAELFSLIGTPPAKTKPAPEPVSAEAKAKVAARKPKAVAGFAGKTVVITGTLSMGRAEVARLLEAAGAKVTGSVSANTHYLVTGDGVGAAKIGKATALGVTVIDEAKMHEMLA